jgi:antibiotic biosynthesis monooxygenase (ABM) superfamily enzyme
MNQALYAHMNNKRKMKKKKNSEIHRGFANIWKKALFFFCATFIVSCMKNTIISCKHIKRMNVYLLLLLKNLVMISTMPQIPMDK